jgi:uncharacterized protein
VKLFLAGRMDPNVGSIAGDTALILAVTRRHTKIIYMLLKAKANVNEAVSCGLTAGWTALDFAIPNKDLLRLLLRKGVNSQTINNAFVTAAGCSDIECMQILLGKGANLTEAGTKALVKAAEHKREGHEGRDTVMFLLDRGIDPNGRNDDCWTALLIAVLNGNKSVVQALLDRGAEINAKTGEWGSLGGGCTALMLAISEQHYELAKLLIEKKADVNIRNDLGKTALIIAADARFSGPQVLPIINILLENGADLETQDTDGSTALMKAAFSGHTDIVRVLLERGADVKKKSKEGRTALHFAAKWGDADMVFDLLDKGADVNARDYLGITPLMRAARYSRSDVVSLLLERGASASEKDITGKTAVQFAEERPPRLDDSEESTYQRVQILRMLTAAGAK